MSVHSEIEKVRQIREYLDSLGEGDPQLKLDTLEGETGIFELMDWALNKLADEDYMQMAVSTHMDDLEARLKASKTRSERFREVLTMCVNATGEKSIRRPLATLSLGWRSPEIRSIEEGLLPDSYWKTERRPDKAAIRDAVKAGASIEGVVLDNGKQVLTVRRK